MEIIKLVELKEKKNMKKDEQSLMDLWETMKQTSHVHCQISRRRQKRKSEYLKKQWLKIFQI